MGLLIFNEYKYLILKSKIKAKTKYRKHIQKIIEYIGLIKKVETKTKTMKNFIESKQLISKSQTKSNKENENDAKKKII